MPHCFIDIFLLGGWSVSDFAPALAGQRTSIMSFHIPLRFGYASSALGRQWSRHAAPALARANHIQRSVDGGVQSRCAREAHVRRGCHRPARRRDTAFIQQSAPVRSSHSHSHSDDRRVSPSHRFRRRHCVNPSSPSSPAVASFDSRHQHHV